MGKREETNTLTYAEYKKHIWAKFPDKFNTLHVRAFFAVVQGLNSSLIQARKALHHLRNSTSL
jgi:hypothetical protein